MARAAKVVALVFALGVCACSTNRDVLSAPEPRTFDEYLRSTHPSDILVTDKSGGTHWFHDPVVDGDTLRGVRNHELPQPRLAIAIAEVARVEEPHFSAVKTVGYFGAFTAAVVLVVIAIAGNVHASY